MARQQIVTYTYTCDVCGTEIPEDDMADASRRVIWEGAQHVVDVCGTHGSELGELGDRLKVFVDAGRRQASRRSAAAGAATKSKSGARASRRSLGPTRSAPEAQRSDVGVIRVWALENGYRVGDRGRIPATILAAYDEASGTPKATAKRVSRSRSKAAAR